MNQEKVLLSNIEEYILEINQQIASLQKYQPIAFDPTISIILYRLAAVEARLDLFNK